MINHVINHAISLLGEMPEIGREPEEVGRVVKFPCESDPE